MTPLPLDLPEQREPTAAPSIRPHAARFNSDLASPLLRKQQASEKAQARFTFDADNLPLFAAGN